MLISVGAVHWWYYRHIPGQCILKLYPEFGTNNIQQSGLSRSHHNKDHQVFFFHYAFPNFIPLGPTAMHLMWNRLRPWDFTAVYSLLGQPYANPMSKIWSSKVCSVKQSIKRTMDTHCWKNNQVHNSLGWQTFLQVILSRFYFTGVGFGSTLK